MLDHFMFCYKCFRIVYNVAIYNIPMLQVINDYNVSLMLLVLVSKEGVTLRSPGCSGIPSVDHCSIKLIVLCASVSQVLGL